MRSTMRVLGGEYGSRSLYFPRTRDIRPATARIKKVIFDIVPHKLDGLRVLDLYAGVGSLGIEAISRGAEWVSFVEIGRLGIQYIKKNLAALDISQGFEIRSQDVCVAIEDLYRTGMKFDIILSDPPYDKGLIKNTLLALQRFDILTQHGRILTEHTRHESLGDWLEFEVVRTRVYGITHLTVLRKPE